MDIGNKGYGKAHTIERISYVREMLVELRLVAESENADLLCYLIEMACVEAGDILNRPGGTSFTHGKGDKPPGMPV
ncbi:hypothetical protein FE840_011635 [Peteryoungia desertarenae]|uniref:Uncharacterized protein n=1 Tax=Peteryoungia desertarenae TaxID=1813451 RepID=A0ABX6QNF2_9HYPH|nr:hypothetical protein [Peteryoungia desertarenae]QLF70136.1 hypothetical protein FE840_011635 [Peteryoungia desertarenae]